MSQENVEVVRQPLTVAADSRRRPEERAGLRFPGVLARINRLAFRLPARSRLRQAVVRRNTQLGLEAVNRGDFEAAFVLYDPLVELITEPRFVELGFERVYRGRAERIASNNVGHERKAVWVGSFATEAEALEAVGLRD